MTKIKKRAPKKKTVYVTIPSGRRMTEKQVQKATSAIVRDALVGEEVFDAKGKRLSGAEKCKYLRHRRPDSGRTNIKWMEHSSHVIKGVCGTCFKEFDTSKPEDLALWQEDPRNEKNMGRASQAEDGIQSTPVIKYIAVPEIFDNGLHRLWIKICRFFMNPDFKVDG